MAISHSFSPFSPGDFRLELQSLDATHSSNFSLPPFSRPRSPDVYTPLRLYLVHVNRSLLRTGTVRLLLPFRLLSYSQTASPSPSRSSFPTEKRFIDCPTPAHSTLSVSPRATILFAGTRPSAFHGFLSEDVSFLEFRPRFFRQSGTEIASPVSSYRLAKVPGSKVETVERKKMVGTLQTWTETFPLSPFAFFHPVIYNPSLKVSLSPPSLL